MKLVIMSDYIHIPLTRHEVMQALVKALSSNFLDNLRNRHPNVRLDNKLRGYVGEMAFQKWAEQYDIRFEAYNQMMENDAMDIDFLYQKNSKELHLELKTSLIPDQDETLEETIKQRDIKLIRRQSEPIEALKGDVHVQLYFKQLRLRKDEWLATQAINFDDSVEKIYQALAAFRYERDTYFVRWIDKESLIQQIQKKAERSRCWSYGKRSFWSCNLHQESKLPQALIDYLK